jgi:hypothetical protein
VNRRHLFVVGSPRSGTTWLQLLLARHEEIATHKETQLFTQYVTRLQERWEEELEEAENGTTNGLSRVMSENQFFDAVKALCDRVFDRLAEEKPGAAIVLEKSPEHGLHAETILRLYPEAEFIHIIRDPRAVSNSFRHAARKWWSWAPSGPVSTTRRWRENVEVARRIPELTDRYREVRYEDLLSEGPSILQGLFDWLSLEASPGFCAEAVEACAIEKLKRGDGSGSQPWEVGKEPEGFFRAGKAEGWREELSKGAIRVIEHEAGTLMDELQYPRVFKRGRRPFRSWCHDLFRTSHGAGRDLGERVAWRLRRLESRI